MTIRRLTACGFALAMLAAGAAHGQTPASFGPTGYGYEPRAAYPEANAGAEWVSDRTAQTPGAKPIRRLPRQTQNDSIDGRDPHGVGPSRTAAQANSQLPFAHLLGLPDTKASRESRPHQASPPKGPRRISQAYAAVEAAHTESRGSAADRTSHEPQPENSLQAQGDGRTPPPSKRESDGRSSFAAWFLRSVGRTKTQNEDQQATVVDKASATMAQTPERESHQPSIVEHPNPPAQDHTRSRAGKSALVALFDEKLLGDDPADAPATRDGSSVSIAATNAAGAMNVPPADGASASVVRSSQTISAAPKGLSTEFEVVATEHVVSEGEYRQAVAASPVAENPFHRPKIIFQPVVGGVDSRGNALLRPDVQLAGEDIAASGPQGVQLTQFADDEGLPPPGGLAPEMAYPVDDEWMPPVVAGECGDPCAEAHSSSPEICHTIHSHLHGHHKQPYAGVGREYVMHAPFFLDTTQPFNNCRIRGDAAFDLEFPDRAEWFWAKTPGGKGPQDPSPDFDRGEKRVNYQDVSFYIERGFERFSIGTEIPIRAVDPVYRLNSAGLANMEVTSKLVFLDGCRWQLTQLFTTHLPTGSFKRGTGNGHVSLEPGVAWRFRWHDDTYIFGDLTYLFPIGADFFHAGQFLNYGIGISHVWIDADSYAIIPTFEVEAWTVLDGRQTLPGVLENPANFNDDRNFHEIDTLSIVNIAPGLRWVCDKGGDCAVKEFGISAGTAVTNDHWYRGILRLEFRWSR